MTYWVPGLLVMGTLAGCSSSAEVSTPVPTRPVASIEESADSALVSQKVVQTDTVFVWRQDVEVPPGVDSLIAFRADSLGHFWYVSAAAEREAAELVERGSILYNENSGQDQMALRMAGRAAEIDRFNVAAYQLRARLLLRLHDNDRPVDLDEALSSADSALSLDRGRDVLYADKALVHRARKEWVDAGLFFDQALQMAERAHEFYQTPIDSGLVLGWALNATDSWITARRSEEAVTAVLGADRYTQTESERESVESRRTFLAWDDGNITATLIRDSLRTRSDSLTDAPAAQLLPLVGRWRELLEMVESRPAREEVTWELAISEYNAGSGDAAVGRLSSLAQTFDSPASSWIGADTLRHDILKTLGDLSARLGQKALDKNGDRTVALAYFLHSLNQPWPGRSRAGNAAAGLLSPNPVASLKVAEQSLTYADEREEERVIRTRMMDLYRVLGRFDDAREQKQALLGLEKSDEETDAS